MSDIFISYAREDRPSAERLAGALEAQGWSVWWDRAIPAGKTFDEVIEKAINAARCVIVLWSKESVPSRWVRTEAEEGARRDVLVPVLIEEATIPLAFRRIQAADLTGWGGDQAAPAFEQLVGDLAMILGPSPLAKEEKQRRQPEEERKAEDERRRRAEARRQAELEEEQQRAKAAEERQAEEERARAEAERRRAEQVPVAAPAAPADKPTGERGAASAVPSRSRKAAILIAVAALIVVWLVVKLWPSPRAPTVLPPTAELGADPIVIDQRDSAGAQDWDPFPRLPEYQHLGIARDLDSSAYDGLRACLRRFDSAVGGQYFAAIVEVTAVDGSGSPDTSDAVPYVDALYQAWRPSGRLDPETHVLTVLSLRNRAIAIHPGNRWGDLGFEGDAIRRTIDGSSFGSYARGGEYGLALCDLALAIDRRLAALAESATRAPGVELPT